MNGSKRRLRGRGKQATWELRVHAGKHPVTGRPRYLSRSVHGDAKAADEELQKFVAEVTGANTTTTGTLGSLLDRWLASTSALKDLSPTTVREYKRIITKTIKPVLGETELRQVDGKVLDAFYTSLITRKPPLSSASVRQVHAIIRAACAQGVKWGELSSNPATRATPPTVRHNAKATPTPKEIQKMIAEAEKDDHDMATLIALAAVTGARRGEILGLQWGDVDLERGVLVIERSVAVVDGEWVTKGTKTHQKRVAALDPFGLEMLRRHRERMEDRVTLG
jgi:integrase